MAVILLHEFALLHVDAAAPDVLDALHPRMIVDRRLLFRSPGQDDDAIVAFLVAMQQAARVFYRSAGWRGFGLYPLATAAVSIIVLVAMIRSEAKRDGTGAHQRFFLALLFAWLVTLAWRIRGDTDVSAEGLLTRYYGDTPF